MVGRRILEDILGRVAQYVDEHYPVDKWHLGDFSMGSTIGVKISSTYLELSTKTTDDRCPNCHPLFWLVRLQSVISTVFTEDDTLLQVARGRQNPVDTAYDVGSVVSVLADVGSSSQPSVSRLLMVSLDGTGWHWMSGREQLPYRSDQFSIFLLIRPPITIASTAAVFIAVVVGRRSYIKLSQFINVNDWLRNIIICISLTRLHSLGSLLDEVETDQATEEPYEMMDINHDRENKLEKSNENKTYELKGKFSNAT
ncbi:hypothetical protein TNCV_3444621 [Trichonephila clavipes]|nr:hypothetical protein TNCV_3444621 [Trichonephila clavipes]